MARKIKKSAKTEFNLLNTNLVLTVLSFVVLFLLVSVVEAGDFGSRARGALDAVGGLKVVASVLSISLAGLLGIVLPLQRAVKEMVDVVVCIKALISKYSGIPELTQLKREINEALEAAALVFDKVPTAKRYARRLRGLKFPLGA